jgi:hypothetical protein
MNSFENGAAPAPELEYRLETPVEQTPPAPVNPIRTAAGRLGGKCVHRLAELGREYEREHGLKPGRQRLAQLVQLGRRYEQEHGLAPVREPRRPKADRWQRFLKSLAPIVRPEYRPALDQLVAALRVFPEPSVQPPEPRPVERLVGAVAATNRDPA